MVVGLVAEEVTPMTPQPTDITSLHLAAAAFLMFGWSWVALPDWFGIVRTVMMALGGLVVIALVLIVAVAIISGLMGMIGKLRRKN
jgi:hypothetical protein